MPISLKDWTGQVKQAEASANDLRRQLVEQEAKEAAAKAAAEQAAKQEAAERKQAERAAATRAAEMERQLPALLSEAARLASEAPTPKYGTRVAARDLLRMEPRGDRATALLSSVVGADPAAALLLRSKQATEQQLGQAEATLGPDHAAVNKLDGVESALWRGFLARLTTLAGEDR